MSEVIGVLGLLGIVALFLYSTSLPAFVPTSIGPNSDLTNYGNADMVIDMVTRDEIVDFRNSGFDPLSASPKLRSLLEAYKIEMTDEVQNLFWSV